MNAQTIGEVIREGVEARGWGGASHLADAVGVRQPTVSKWMTGGIVPKSDKWPLIESFLELKPGTLKKASQNENPTTAMRIAELEAENERLRSEFDAMQDRLKAIYERFDID